jgi:hypothetical protein
MAVDKDYIPVYMDILQNKIGDIYYGDVLINSFNCITTFDSNLIFSIKNLLENDCKDIALYIKYMGYRLRTKDILEEEVVNLIIKKAQKEAEKCNQYAFTEANIALLELYTISDNFKNKLITELINLIPLIENYHPICYNELITSLINNWGINNKTRIF